MLYGKSKMKFGYFFVLSLLFVGGFIFLNVVGCSDKVVAEKANDVGTAVLRFSLELDPEVYSRSRYKKPPQFAVWLEDKSHGIVRTVWVTEKTGSCEWGGNIVRPVSLPYWVGRWNLETQSKGDPAPGNSVIDAVTGATPKVTFIAEAVVPGGSVWDYFIEINVSGDFNDAFAAKHDNGDKDRHGNGQPSLIYQGKITALDGRKDSPELVGRTEQLQSVKNIISDLQGITTAKEVLLGFQVLCEKQ